MTEFLQHLIASAVLLTSVLAWTPMAMSDDTHDTTHAFPANKLASETSPYLLQHAYNPVHWYPWGDEAFAAARDQNKPIFLSIGYSTCYWCHVMERESFENPEVAELLNAYFIPIKVDREERPDVDDVYMTAVQIMTRHGGWPMSVFIEPDTLMPFFGGTYFPLYDQGQRPGFLNLCEAIHQAWLEKEPELRAQAEKVGEAVARRLAAEPLTEAPREDIVDAAIAQLMASYDPTHGGYGDAPKFPMPVHLDLLIQTGWEQPEVQASLRHTLDRMAMGGMYDQVGGGFHRYSTDAEWLVPHFEKMLYDNGMLASIYAEACERTGDGFYCAIAAEIVDYVLREMVDPSGAFWSAQDAESNAREGESYLWTPGQIDEVLAEAGLSEEDATFIKLVYGLDAGPNFQDPHHPGEPPSNVLHLVDRPHDLATAHGLSGGDFHARIMAINRALLAHRDTRDQPLTDDKILSGWNGLMIGGMADTGRVLERPEYIHSASRAADAIKTRMWSPQEGLKRTARGDTVNTIAAFLEDYAFMVRGLLRLYEATGDPKDLEWAEALMVQARAQFWAEPHGWLDAPEGQSDLFVRGRSLYDGAVPSGTSVMLDNQVRLAEITRDDQWRQAARDGVKRIGWNMNRSPQGTSQAVVAYQRLMTVPVDEAPTPPADSSGPVTVRLEPSTMTAIDGQATVDLIMSIKPPYHVSLRDPDRHDILPLDILTRTKGVTLEVDWPRGHPFTGPLGSVQVVSNIVRIPVKLSVPEGHAGPVGVIVSWQACDERMCLLPRTEVLTVEIASGS